MSRCHRVALIWLPVVAACLPGIFPGGHARADIFLLENGGRIEGEWLNRNQESGPDYRVRTDYGGVVSIAADQVRQLIRQRPVQRQYEQLAPTHGDTVAEQWRMAEWCREHHLAAQRERHLRRVVQLDDQYAAAWIALGYSQFQGRWRRPEEVARDNGYERDRGRWRLAQEIGLLDEREQRERAELDWQRRIERLKTQMAHPERALEAQRELLEIRDPNAVRALGACLLRDVRPGVRIMAAEALSQIGTPPAVNLLVLSSLREPNSDVFHEVADRLIQRRFPSLTLIYVKSLRHENNYIVNRAAHMLGRLGDTSAIDPLIDALITTHVAVLNPSSQPDATTATFSKDGDSNSPLGQGTGLSKPGAPVPVPIYVRNEEVLTALVKLTGGVTYQFDQRSWRVWQASRKQRQSSAIEVRRGE